MIDQATFNDFQDFCLRLYGPLWQWLLVFLVLVVVGIVILILALGLLRRMKNP